MKLNYKDCKGLNDAGFPQGLEHGDNAYCVCCEESHLIHRDNDEGGLVGNDYSHRFDSVIGWIKEPSLAELIEGCGDEFYSLEKYSVLEGMVCEDGWGAFGSRSIDAFGSNPEQAVKNLYIALKK